MNSETDKVSSGLDKMSSTNMTLNELWLVGSDDQIICINIKSTDLKKMVKMCWVGFNSKVLDWLNEVSSGLHTRIQNTGNKGAKDKCIYERKIFNFQNNNFRLADKDSDRIQTEKYKKKEREKINSR